MRIRLSPVMGVCLLVWSQPYFKRCVYRHHVGGFLSTVVAIWMTGWTTLHRICVTCDTNGSHLQVQVEALRDEINELSEREVSPLHFVALGENIKLATWLLQNKAEFFQNEYDESPLHWACKVGYFPMVQVLLSHMTPSEINETDIDNLTALDWAREHGHNHIVNLLERTIAGISKNSKVSHKKQHNSSSQLPRRLSVS